MQGWMIDGFLAWIGLWIWLGLAMLHALFRGLHGPDGDPIRPSGPIR